MVEAEYRLPNPGVTPAVIAAAVGGDGAGKDAVGGRWLLKARFPVVGPGIAACALSRCVSLPFHPLSMQADGALVPKFAFACLTSL